MQLRITQAEWEELYQAAYQAMELAYAPYSNFPVGAAALVESHPRGDLTRIPTRRIVAGCNVENAAYGVCLCAECGMISDLIHTGGGKLLAITILGATGEPCAPCGRCRQLIEEHSYPYTQILMPAGITTVDQLLPQAFGAADLERIAQAGQLSALQARKGESE